MELKDYVYQTEKISGVRHFPDYIQDPLNKMPRIKTIAVANDGKTPYLIGEIPTTVFNAVRVNDFFYANKQKFRFTHLEVDRLWAVLV